MPTLEAIAARINNPNLKKVGPLFPPRIPSKRSHNVLIKKSFFFQLQFKVTKQKDTAMRKTMEGRSEDMEGSETINMIEVTRVFSVKRFHFE